MQSPPPMNDDVNDSRSLNTTPLTCPYSVTIRRNPSRKARPTPQRAAVPFDSHQADAISDFPTDDVLSTELLSRKEIVVGGGDSCADESRLSEDLKVFLRIRPLKERFGRRVSKEDGELRMKRNAWPKARKERDVAKDRVLKKSPVSCIVVNDTRSVTVSPPLGQQDSRRIKSEAYEGFSQVFEPESSQEQVYDTMMRPLVEDFLKGKSGMLVAMGPSGSGKTHTVFGSPRKPGMVPLALRHLFQRNEEGHSTSLRSFYITIFEISSEPGRGEKILDLLSDGADISIYQSTIKGLQEIVISDVTQAESVIASAMLKRSTAVTNANSQSSRSQCIINIHMVTENFEGHGGDMFNSSVLTIIDLAGAEKSKRTGLQGKRLGESSFINNTSMVFGLCLRSLFEHQKNPKKPLQKHFQSSLLTRYLRDYLEGKKRMSLILTVKSEEEDYTDTSFVLRQASPYMQIKFTATPKSDLLGAKRHFQTSVRSDQVKRVKFGNFTGPKADRNGSETKTDHQPDEGATCTSEINQSLPQSLPVESPEVKRNENNDDAPCDMKVLQRSSQIMQNFAKALWNVLKEYKSKLQVAKDEIHNLKENLDFEKNRRVELESEIQYLKTNCSCSKEISTDCDLVKVDTYLEFSVERSQKRDDVTCVTDEATTALISSELAEPEEKEYDRQSDTRVLLGFTSPNSPKSPSMKHGEIMRPISAETDGCCKLLDASHDKQDQRSPELVESDSVENDQLSHASVLTSIVDDEHCSLPGSSQEKHEQEIESLPDSMPNNTSTEQSSEVAMLAVSSLSTAEIRVDSPQTKTDKPMLHSDENKEIPSNKHLKQKDEKCGNGLMGNDELHKTDTKPSPPRLCNLKPKRRLMPASTVLLRDMQLLDLEDESDNRAKGNRGRKNPATEENQRTQGNINLLRLLKSNLHR